MPSVSASAMPSAASWQSSRFARSMSSLRAMARPPSCLRRRFYAHTCKPSSTALYASSGSPCRNHCSTASIVDCASGASWDLALVSTMSCNSTAGPAGPSAGCHTPPPLPHGLATNDCDTHPVEPLRLCNGSVAKMSGRLDALFELVRRGLVEPLGRLGGSVVAALRSLTPDLWRVRWRVVIIAVVVLIVYGLCTHPPFDSVRRGEALARTDALDGSVSVYTAGTVFVRPGVHQVRRYSIRDQVYRPAESASATGPAPFQSVEGLSIGVDLAVRWTVDRARLAQMSKEFPDDISADLVAPAVQSIVYPTFARYSVREIFSQRRTEIQEELTTQLKPKF